MVVARKFSELSIIIIGRKADAAFLLLYHNHSCQKWDFLSKIEFCSLKIGKK